MSQTAGSLRGSRSSHASYSATLGAAAQSLGRVCVSVARPSALRCRCKTARRRLYVCEPRA